MQHRSGTTWAHPHHEPHGGSIGARLNWLRAGVLGANDGIVSTAGLVIGVAAATPAPAAILTSGIAGLAAGAMSMAVGEYVSVSTQRDTEQALIAKETRELEEEPEAELAELAGLYQLKGLSRDLAQKVAEELTEHDALRAHADIELRIDPDDYTNPWVAAGASFVAFSVGAIIPILAIIVPSSEAARVPVTFVSVVFALLLTGYVSARLGSSSVRKAMIRVPAGGILAMAVTYGIGALVGTQIT